MNLLSLSTWLIIYLIGARDCLLGLPQGGILQQMPVQKDLRNKEGFRTGKITPKSAVWIDRFNGRKYPLPTIIGDKPVSFYLHNPQVSPLAKALYRARFRPTDNDSTTRLLALVTTDNDQIRPFYRWCLDFTISISDGALGEYPGKPALAYATKFPQEFFAYVNKDAPRGRYERWVESIAYSGLDYDESPLQNKREIVRRMTKNCEECSATLRSRINSFASHVTHVAEGDDLFQR